MTAPPNPPLGDDDTLVGDDAPAGGMDDTMDAPSMGGDDTLAAIDGVTDGDPAVALARSRLRASLFDAPRESVSVGRFSLIERLGAGGMGVVYRAYDPQLRREVAVKLLHTDDGGGSNGRARLIREAQTMARLSHPNVVQVFEVGEHGQAVFVAMELIEGRTLGRWMQEEHTPQDVVAMFVEVGKGLAAAHEAGIVHRDFKPANVLLGDDGRPRVLDFGLAREPTRTTTTQDELPADVDALTQAGALVGTPAYMSPEQFGSRPLDARTDQFSFCVALWEALYGTRPFSADTSAALATAVLLGERTAPSSDSVPRWLRDICNRGLAIEVEARYGSMTDLLSALSRGAQRRARILGGAAVAGVLAVGLAAWAVHEVDQARRRRTCAREAARDVGWSKEASTAVGDALRSTSTSFSEVSAATTTGLLDAHAQQWVDTSVRACEAQHVDRTLAAVDAARVRWCLEQRTMAMAMLVDELRNADAAMTIAAVDATNTLAPPSACERAETLPPAREAKADVEDALSRRFRAETLLATSQPKAGLDAAREAHAAAQEVGDPRLLFAADATLAKALDQTGDRGQAETVYERAYFAAVEAGRPDEAGAIAAHLTKVIGVSLARADDGLRWAKHARARLREADTSEESLDWIAHLSSRGLALRQAGRLEEARDDLRRVVVLAEAVVGEHHPLLARALVNTGMVEADLGDIQQSNAHYTRGLAILSESLGAEHPSVGAATHNLANLLFGRGEYEAAIDRMETAVRLRRAGLGPDHADLAQSVTNLAAFYAATGRSEEATTTYAEAERIVTVALGPDHPNLAYVLQGLGVLAMERKDWKEAEQHFARALELRERTIGPDHADLAYSLSQLGMVHLQTGRLSEARALEERGLAIRRAALGEDHVHVANSVAALGDIDLAEGKADDAVRRLEDALRRFEAEPGRQQGELEARFSLSKALFAAGQQQRARTLAEAVLREAKTEGGASVPDQDVREWLEAHPMAH